jgi:hypothetical protein
MEPEVEKFVVRFVSLKFPSKKQREITTKERKRIIKVCTVFNDTRTPSVQFTVPIDGHVELESDLGSWQLRK